MSASILKMPKHLSRVGLFRLWARNWFDPTFSREPLTRREQWKADHAGDGWGEQRELFQ